MTTTALFTASDLNDLPEIDGVTDEEAAVVERIVWGWLKPLRGLDERPDPVDDDLFAWALELGAIYRTNPAGLSAKQMGHFQEQYSSERRDEILRMAAGGGVLAPGAPPKPVGSFPDPNAFPDSSDRFALWWF